MARVIYGTLSPSVRLQATCQLEAVLSQHLGDHAASQSAMSQALGKSVFVFESGFERPSDFWVWQVSVLASCTRKLPVHLWAGSFRPVWSGQQY